MNRLLSRRTLMTSAAAMTVTPVVQSSAGLADEPLLLRCSLETAPTHTRNVVIRDYLSRIEAGSDGNIKTQLFESGQLFPDLQVGKALLEGQIDMAIPGTWSMTGVLSDADLFQLPILYGRSIALTLLHDAIHSSCWRCCYTNFHQLRDTTNASSCLYTQILIRFPTSSLPGH